MNFQRQSRISQQKRWKIMGMMWSIIEAIQKKANLITSSSVQSTFYRKYRNTSLSILNNFQTKSQAIQTSKQYQVPLMHIQIATSQEQDYIWKYILNSFQNSQILNQGFVLWVQFDPTFFQQKNQTQPDLTNKQALTQNGTIQCYYNQIIYKRLKIKQLPQSQEEINQLLNSLRTQYYNLNDQQFIGNSNIKINIQIGEKNSQENINRKENCQLQKKHHQQEKKCIRKEEIKIIQANQQDNQNDQVQNNYQPKKINNQSQQKLSLQQNKNQLIKQEQLKKD